MASLIDLLVLQNARRVPEGSVRLALDLQAIYLLENETIFSGESACANAWPIKVN